jgi:hypothetical protein
MGNNLQGLGRPGAGSLSPQPSPSRAAPTILNPVDADPTSVANRSDPQYRLMVDELAWVKGSVQFCPPIAPASASSGYSASTYNAFGGTVTPSGDGSTYNSRSGTNFVILCTLGGAVGAAKFKVSVDGGTTYGAEQTTSASMTDATTGITLAFAGTLTLNGTAQFHSAYSAMAAFADAGGKVRALFDHLGYPAGRRSEWREEWLYAATFSTTGSNVYNNVWNVVLSGTGPSLIPTNGFATSGNYLGKTMSFNTGTTAGATLNLNRSGLAFGCTFGAIVLETEVAFSVIGASSNATWQFGFGDTSTLTGGNNYFYVRKAGTETTFKLICKNNGGSITTVDTGVAPVANTINTIRLVWLGSATFMGATTILLFIDGKLKAAVQDATVPNQAAVAILCLIGSTIANGVSEIMNMGPLVVHFGRFASLDSV